MTMTISKDLNIAIVQIGENKSSNGYEEVGVVTDVYYYPENITEFELKDELTQLQEFYDKVIMQLPLPQHIRPSTAPAAMIVEIKEEKENATK